MRLMSLSLLLAACSPDATEPALLAQGDLAPPTLPLEVPAILTVGETFELRVASGLLPNERVFFARGTRIGAGPCLPVAGGYCTEIRNPEVVGTARADAAGVATLELTVPNSVPDGLTVPFQALVVRGIGGADSAWSVPVEGVTDVLEPGCTDPGAVNYDGMADVEDGSCIFWSCTAGVCTETRVQQDGEDRDLDLLVVVDQSGSMSEEQGWLQGAAPDIVDILDARGGDWHLGVITPDMDNAAQSGRLIAQVNAGGNAVAELTSAFTPDTNGSPDERHYDAVLAALGPLANTANAGFRRADARLAVATVSDEDDFSNIPTADFVSELASQSALPVTFSAMTEVIGQPCFFLGQGGAARHASVTAATGGVLESICFNTVAGFFDALVPESSTLVRSFFLECSPANPAITVTVDGSIIAFSSIDGWTYDAATREIRFWGDAVPEAGQDIVFTYAESQDCL